MRFGESELDSEALPLADRYRVVRGLSEALATPLSDADATRQMLSQALKQVGTLDILVNNAGIVRDGAIWNMGEADFDVRVKVSVWTVRCATLRAAVEGYLGRAL